MRKPGGYHIITDPDPPKGVSTNIEADTFTCAHHGGIVFVKPMCDPADMGARCGGCGNLICKFCAREMDRTFKCVPIEARLEQWESRDRFRRDFEKL